VLHLQFTAEAVAALESERFHHPHPRVQRRMEALWLKSQGLPHGQIARLTGVSANTLRAYFRLFQHGGVAALKRFDTHRPVSDLDRHRRSLEDHFLEHPFATAKEAQAVIARLTGIERSPTQVRQFLKRLGLRPRKVGLLPAKADPDEQAEFREKNLSPGCARRKRGVGSCTR
jgi:transposase